LTFNIEHSEAGKESPSFSLLFSNNIKKGEPSDKALRMTDKGRLIFTYINFGTLSENIKN
jgi:hypothetical protein